MLQMYADHFMDISDVDPDADQRYRSFNKNLGLISEEVSYLFLFIRVLECLD